MSNTSVDRVPDKGLSFPCPRSTGLHPKQEFDIAGWNLSFSFEFFIICVLLKDHSAHVQITTLLMSPAYSIGLFLLVNFSFTHRICLHDYHI